MTSWKYCFAKQEFDEKPLLESSAAFGLAEQPIPHLESDALVGTFLASQLQNIPRQRPVPASTWLYLSSLGHCWVMAGCPTVMVLPSQLFVAKARAPTMHPHQSCKVSASVHSGGSSKKCNHALTCLHFFGTGWYMMVLHGAGTVSVSLLDLVELESGVNEQWWQKLGGRKLCWNVPN